jgi:hypothetical protein
MALVARKCAADKLVQGGGSSLSSTSNSVSICTFVPVKQVI